MVYYPYFRGKRFELIAIREKAELMAKHGFVPIISPISKQFRGLEKALEALSTSGAESIVIINPEYGELSHDTSELDELLKGKFGSYERLKIGVRIDAKHTTDQVIDVILKANGRPIAIIHSGFKHPKDLAAKLEQTAPYVQTHVFVDDHCGKLYRDKFKEFSEGIVIRDGFKHRRNQDHPDVEFFSENHVTYTTEIMNKTKGFGDFLIVGDRFSETGGPAYTVAIHLTFIDPEQDNAMYIRHYLSDRRDTPTDPGGKFHEALTHLVNEIGADSHFINSSAIQEFRQLHKMGHFPGLGRAKKLSVVHHIETMANYFSKKQKVK